MEKKKKKTLSEKAVEWLTKKATDKKNVSPTSKYIRKSKSREKTTNDRIQQEFGSNF